MVRNKLDFPVVLTLTFCLVIPNVFHIKELKQSIKNDVGFLDKILSTHNFDQVFAGLILIHMNTREDGIDEMELINLIDPLVKKSGAHHTIRCANHQSYCINS